MSKKINEYIKKGFRLKEGFILIFIGFLMTWVIQYLMYLKATEEADLNISFKIKDVSPYSPLTMPNSHIIFDPPIPQYVRPDNRKLNEIIIRNDSKMKASSVDVLLRIKSPFVFCLINLNSTKHPKSEWSIKSFDREESEFVTINLTRINSKSEAQIYIVYSYPSAELDEEKKIEIEALQITVVSPDQKRTISEEYNLEYYDHKTQ